MCIRDSPHPQWIADVSTSDPVDLELYGSPDTVNIEDIMSVDVMSSISTSAPDMSVIESMSIDRGREIQDAATAMLELADTAATAIGASWFRNPSPKFNTFLGNACIFDIVS